MRSAYRRPGRMQVTWSSDEYYLNGADHRRPRPMTAPNTLVRLSCHKTLWKTERPTQECHTVCRGRLDGMILPVLNRLMGCNCCGGIRVCLPAERYVASGSHAASVDARRLHYAREAWCRATAPRRAEVQDLILLGVTSTQKNCCQFAHSGLKGLGTFCSWAVEYWERHLSSAIGAGVCRCPLRLRTTAVSSLSAHLQRINDMQSSDTEP